MNEFLFSLVSTAQSRLVPKSTLSVSLLDDWDCALIESNMSSETVC